MQLALHLWMLKRMIWYRSGAGTIAGGAPWSATPLSAGPPRLPSALCRFTRIRRVKRRWPSNSAFYLWSA